MNRARYSAMFCYLYGRLAPRKNRHSFTSPSSVLFSSSSSLSPPSSKLTTIRGLDVDPAGRNHLGRLVRVPSFRNLQGIYCAQEASDNTWTRFISFIQRWMRKLNNALVDFVAVVRTPVISSLIVSAGLD